MEDGEGGLQSPAWFPLVGLFEGMMKKQCDYLVVSTHLKNMSQIGSFNPNLRDEHKKYLKLPPPM